MKILLIGANGKVGRRLVPLLSERGHMVRTMVRRKEQVKKMEALGGIPYINDLEADFSSGMTGIDCVIFTAGSGAHTGPDKTIDIDQNAAIRSIDLAKAYGVELYIMVSAQGARDPVKASRIQHYYKAKFQADEHLIGSGLTYTIFRPGRLTNDKGTGLVRCAEFFDEGGETSRDNLALSIAESLNIPNTRNKVAEIFEGDKPVREALQKME